MKIAIMQPYFFPYIGYFQLINSVDKFIIYDDVNYINRGWVNRNNFLSNGKSLLITTPLIKASQNKLINEIFISKETKWEEKMLRTFESLYKKAPYFNEVFELFSRILNKSHSRILDLNIDSIVLICKYLDVNTEIIRSSDKYCNNHLKGEERIIDICIKEKASCYINPIGGLDLYNKINFSNQGIEFNLLKPEVTCYAQFSNDFAPWLSVLDILVFNSKETSKLMLENYTLL